jgi:hypothetical protein
MLLGWDGGKKTLTTETVEGCQGKSVVGAYFGAARPVCFVLDGMRNSIKNSHSQNNNSRVRRRPTTET